MNIQCVYMLKPEARIECLTLLFESHQRVTGKPYLMTITENWLSTGHPVGILDSGNSIQNPKSIWRSSSRLDIEKMKETTRESKTRLAF